MSGSSTLDIAVRRLGADFAFPTWERGAQGPEPTGFGIDLRTYLIAHAPHEPQPWFKPTMPEPRPELENWQDITDEKLREEVHACIFDEVEPQSQFAKEWMDRRGTINQRRHEYDREVDKQAYVQWPGAWADEQLRRIAIYGGFA